MIVCHNLILDIVKSLIIIPSQFDVKFVKNADTKIRQSASKMWTLAILFPLLIGDLVLEECDRFKNVLLLLKICNIAMAWGITPSDISNIAMAWGITPSDITI